jgi:DNA-3-methyladenine glycosylase
VTVVERSFYSRDATTVAKELLGQILVHQTEQGRVSGRIVETEAYLGADDAAAHSYRGETPRTKVMFGEAGHAYVYFTYGMHYCFNVVAHEVGVGQAVLIRALEPLEGIEIMEANRKQTDLRNLCSGPAKLVQALGITKKHNGHDLTEPPLWIEASKDTPWARSILDSNIVTTTRIGISQAADLPLRFYIAGNSFVSRP